MMRTILIIVIIVTLLKNGGDACVFQKTDEVKKAQNIWDTMELKRINSNCECGKANVSMADWNLNIETKSLRDNSVKTCTGTIVASDLIVTSHKCLELSGQRTRLVDILHFKNGEMHIARIDEIKVSSPKDPSKQFPVLKIFYNPQYVISSEKKIYPVNDVVILKAHADFISEQDFNPICLPVYDSTLNDEDILDQPGIYYGPPTNISSGVTLLHGKIFKKAECYMENEVSKSDESLKAKSARATLCLRHEDQEPPKIEGGPLIVTIESSQTSYLVGIAEDINNPKTTEGRGGLASSMGEKYTFFSAINPVVKFIEFHALNEKSKWCKTLPGKVLNTKKASGSRVKPTPKRAKPWPWDQKRTPFQRDESLDCTCGIQNTKIGGRVVGGVEATPREFGWMAVIHLWPNGRKGGASLCGGSIINERMILTAAHCVVSDRKLGEDPSKDPSIAPNDVVVTLNAHLQNRDPEAVQMEVLEVLFHPDYLAGRLARPEFYDSDVAILVLKEKIEFATDKNKGLRPICLSKPGEYIKIIDRIAWVVGWGLTDPKNQRSTANKLQKLEIPIQVNSFCGEVAQTKVTDNNICAGTLDMYKDAASGDSGGPLQIEDKTTYQWYEVGLVSWGEDVDINGQTLTAALYADVQRLMPFIDYHAQRVRTKWCR